MVYLRRFHPSLSSVGSVWQANAECYALKMENSVSLWDVVGSFLASIGGATVIVGAFAHFLGQVWTDRIAKQTVARYEQELETTKTRNTLVLEEFKRKSEIELKDREQFSGISSEVYQDFFKNRVATYIKLLEIKNEYISKMHEDVGTDEGEFWGDIYYSSYVMFRKVLIENQLYISTELERVFHDLRLNAAKYIKEADLAEGYAIRDGAEPWDADEQRSPIHHKLAQETHERLNEVIRQIDSDVSKLRARIDLDRTI